MNCKASEQSISLFLDRSLSGDDLRNFLLHIESCPDCREELGTAYLLEIALDRIEEGESLNLDKELDLKIKAAKSALNQHWCFSNIFRTIEVLAGMMLCLGVVRSFILYITPYLPNFIVF